MQPQVEKKHLHNTRQGRDSLTQGFLYLTIGSRVAFNPPKTAAKIINQQAPQSIYTLFILSRPVSHFRRRDRTQSSARIDKDRFPRGLAVLRLQRRMSPLYPRPSHHTLPSPQPCEASQTTPCFFCQLTDSSRCLPMPESLQKLAPG